MTINYTTLLGLTEPVTGTQSGTWGSDINTGLTDYVEAAIAGAQVISGSQTAVTLSVTTGSSSAPTTLSQAGSGATGSSQYQIIRCTGNPAGLLTITAPASDKTYVILNATSTSQSVKIVGAGPTTGVTIVSGERAFVAWNGSDFVKVGGAAGGTNTQVQFNDNGVFGGSANLTWDGSTLATTGLTASGAVTLSATTQNIALGTSQVGGTWTAGGVSQTGAITLDQSTKTHTLNIGTGATENALTKTINLGTAGVSGSTTAINIGSAVSGATTNVTLNGTVQPGVVISGSSSGDALRITQTGTGNALLVEDSANPDSSPFVVTAAGDVGIGTSSPYSGTKLTLQESASNPGGLAIRNRNSTQTWQLSVDAAAVDDKILAFIDPAAGAVRMALDSSGNLGLGVTPGAWQSGYTVFQARNTSIFTSSTTDLNFGQNVYINSGGNYTYISNGYATLYNQYAGKHYWSTAASGFGYGTAATSLTSTQNGNSYTIVSAGTTDFTLIGAVNNNVGTTFTKSGGTGAGTGTVSQNITFTQAMTLDASANLFVNATSDTGNVNAGSRLLSITGNNTNPPEIKCNGSDAEISIAGGASASYLWSTGAYPLVIAINSTERARITSGGDLGVGTSSPGEKLEVAGNIKSTGTSSTVVPSTNTQSASFISTNASGNFFHAIDNSTGTAFGAGAYSRVLYSSGAYPMAFFTNDTERARITSGGDLGVGASSPNGRVESRTATVVPGDSAYAKKAFVANIPLSTSNVISSLVAAFDNTIHGADVGYAYDGTGYYLAFATNSTVSGSPTERARITRGGDLLVGKTSFSQTSVGFEAAPTGQTDCTMSASTNSTSTLNIYSTGASAYRFYVGMGGTVYATSTTISAISDRRFKENVQDLDIGLDAVMALKPRKFDWKEGKGKDIKGDRGFIAQEFEQVFPDLIDEWKDPAPEGEEPYKSVRQDLIPVLVKAIQEQQALITSLTARVAALEGTQP